METLTRDEFDEFKAYYPFYRPTYEIDKNGDTRETIPDEPIDAIRVMWHPETDKRIAEAYGIDIASARYAVLYDNPGIHWGDVFIIDGAVWEVAGVMRYNTHDRVTISRRKGQGNGYQA